MNILKSDHVGVIPEKNDGLIVENVLINQLTH